MQYLIKPLTKKMLAQLKRGRAIELSQTGRNICVTNDFKGSLPEFYKLGFLNTKTIVHDDKEMQVIYITQEGINFLNKYEEDEKNWAMNILLPG